jgi:hypothetical protein
VDALHLYEQAHLYEQTQQIALNGSVTLPDYVFRNMGVAFSQLVQLEVRAAWLSCCRVLRPRLSPSSDGCGVLCQVSEDARAGAKQRAAQAFMKYLAYDTLQPDDRTQIESALLSLIAPPPGFEAGREASPPNEEPLESLAARTTRTRRSGEADPARARKKSKKKKRS